MNWIDHLLCYLKEPIAIVLLLLTVMPSVTRADEDRLQSISVTPEQFTIIGKRERLQLVITGTAIEGRLIDLTRIASVNTDSDHIVIENGVITPKSNGVSKIQIEYQGHVANATVTTRSMDQPQAVSFDYHALPVLAQSGCSGGSCHGSPHGKAGFRLSLFGSDRELDRISLTRELFSRRVNLIEPQKSLLLKKPAMQIAHQGGKRFGTEDLQYELLRDWIAEGGKTIHEGPGCVGIEVFPPIRLLKFPQTNQQLSVIASFQDGTRRDVTHLAKYEASDPKVMEVDQTGMVRGITRGESAVIVRYLNFIETPMVTLVRDIDGFQWNDPPVANQVDQLVYDKLKSLQFLPAPQCEDTTFIRRIYLDVLGILPTQEEQKIFHEDSADDKRDRLIDELLEREEYDKFWAQKWGDLLRVSTKLISAPDVYKFNRWLQRCIAENKPYDQFAREILLATGSTRLNPAGNFYRSAGDTNDAMETTAQVFLGTRIQCAKCHNHPFERWTQDNYYGLTAFFNRLQRSKTQRENEILLWSASEGEVQHPVTNTVAVPWVPSDGEIEVAQLDRREALVEWMTSASNPLFAKIEVNRIWAQVMGRGVVEPFDDFRDSNPPANSPLLEYLASEFIQSGYDRKRLLRLILRSNTYQTSSNSTRWNEADTKYFSHYSPRMLTAEQLVDALGFVTGKPKQFFGVPVGTKATWLPAPDLQPHDRGKIGNIEFLKVFGQPERQSACECERSDDISLGQALEMLNGKLVTEMIFDESNHIHRALKDNVEPSQIIRDFYVRAFSREPTESEVKFHSQYIGNHGNASEALEDICWAVLNHNEFLFQH